MKPYPFASLNHLTLPVELLTGFSPERPVEMGIQRVVADAAILRNRFRHSRYFACLQVTVGRSNPILHEVCQKSRTYRQKSQKLVHFSSKLDLWLGGMTTESKIITIRTDSISRRRKRNGIDR